MAVGVGGPKKQLPHSQSQSHHHPHRHDPDDPVEDLEEEDPDPTPPSSFQPQPSIPSSSFAHTNAHSNSYSNATTNTNGSRGRGRNGTSKRGVGPGGIGVGDEFGSESREQTPKASALNSFAIPSSPAVAAGGGGHGRNDNDNDDKQIQRRDQQQHQHGISNHSKSSASSSPRISTPPIPIPIPPKRNDSSPNPPPPSHHHHYHHHPPPLQGKRPDILRLPDGPGTIDKITQEGLREKEKRSAKSKKSRRERYPSQVPSDQGNPGFPFSFSSSSSEAGSDGMKDRNRIEKFNSTLNSNSNSDGDCDSESQSASDVDSLIRQDIITTITGGNQQQDNIHDQGIFGIEGEDREDGAGGGGEEEEESERGVDSLIDDDGTSSLVSEGLPHKRPHVGPLDIASWALASSIDSVADPQTDSIGKKKEIPARRYNDGMDSVTMEKTLASSWNPHRVSHLATTGLLSSLDSPTPTQTPTQLRSDDILAKMFGDGNSNPNQSAPTSIHPLPFRYGGVSGGQQARDRAELVREGRERLEIGLKLGNMEGLGGTVKVNEELEACMGAGINRDRNRPIASSDASPGLPSPALSKSPTNMDHEGKGKDGYEEHFNDNIPLSHENVGKPRTGTEETITPGRIRSLRNGLAKSGVGDEESRTVELSTAETTKHGGSHRGHSDSGVALLQEDGIDKDADDPEGKWRQALPSNPTHLPTSPRLLRLLFRHSLHPARPMAIQELRSTAGLAPGRLQANLIILPSPYADDFYHFCKRNPVSCPLLAWSSNPGEARAWNPEGIVTTTGGDRRDLRNLVDVRTDLPSYNIYENGVFKRSVTHLGDNEWDEKSVAFLIGCSFSFESALARASLTPPHILASTNVPMFRSNIALTPSLYFGLNRNPIEQQQATEPSTECFGVSRDKPTDLTTNMESCLADSSSPPATMVVSLRLYPRSALPKIRSITSKPGFALAHGGPIAWGWEWAERIGISRQKIESGECDWGDGARGWGKDRKMTFKEWKSFLESSCDHASIELPTAATPPKGQDGNSREEELIPLFWGCGVTPQEVVMRAGIPHQIITHSPGQMLILDSTEDDLLEMERKLGNACYGC